MTPPKSRAPAPSGPAKSELATTIEAVQDLLESLLGRPVHARKPLPTDKPSPRSVAGVYRGDDGSAQALCICDLILAVHASAALTLFPVRAANEAAAQGELTGVLLENLREILNICAQLVNAHTSHHVALAEVTMVNSLPADAAALAKGPAHQLDLQVSIDGYSGGRFALRKLS